MLATDLHPGVGVAAVPLSEQPSLSKWAPLTPKQQALFTPPPMDLSHLPLFVEAV